MRVRAQSVSSVSAEGGIRAISGFGQTWWRVAMSPSARGVRTREVATCYDRGRGRTHGHRRQYEDACKRGPNKLRPSHQCTTHIALPCIACGGALPRPGRTRFGTSALVGQDPDKAEADSVATEGRVHVVSVGRGTVVGTDVPAAATYNPTQTRGRTHRIRTIDK